MNSTCVYFKYSIDAGKLSLEPGIVKDLVLAEHYREREINLREM